MVCGFNRAPTKSPPQPPNLPDFGEYLPDAQAVTLAQAWAALLYPYNVGNIGNISNIGKACLRHKASLQRRWLSITHGILIVGMPYASGYASGHALGIWPMLQAVLSL